MEAVRSDTKTDGSVLERVRAAMAVARDWDEVERSLVKTAARPGEDPLWPAIWAFTYRLRACDAEEAGLRIPYKRWLPFEDGNPPVLPDVSDDALDVWAALADDLADYPLAASRLNDLLWICRREPRPDKRARGAVQAYLALATREHEWLFSAECLSRAVAIAREIGDADLTSRAAGASLAAAQRALNEEDWVPGVVIRFLRPLIGLADGTIDHQAVEQTIRTAQDKYQNDPNIFGALQSLLVELNRGNPEAVQQLHAAEVARWVEEAERSGGVGRLFHFERALALAGEYGISHMVDELRRRIQSIDVNELGLKAVRSEVSMPHEVIDKALKALLEGGVAAAIGRFASQHPATVRAEAVDHEGRSHAFLALAHTTVISEQGIPILAQSGADFEASLKQMLGIQTFATLVATPFLETLPKTFGEPGEDELAGILTTEFIPARRARWMARGLKIYWSGQIEPAAALLLPRIESTLRDVCKRLGITVFTEQAGARAGRVDTLASLIASLEGRIDESLRTYLRLALVDPAGLNIRNRALHGLTEELSNEEVAIVAHIACCVASLKLELGEQQGTN